MASTALPTAGRFPVRRKRPHRPAVDNASRRPWCPRLGVRFKGMADRCRRFLRMPQAGSGCGQGNRCRRTARGHLRRFEPGQSLSRLPRCAEPTGPDERIERADGGAAGWNQCGPAPTVSVPNSPALPKHTDAVCMSDCAMPAGPIIQPVPLPGLPARTDLRTYSCRLAHYPTQESHPAVNVERDRAPQERLALVAA
jgi:hypothetical protein